MARSGPLPDATWGPALRRESPELAAPDLDPEQVRRVTAEVLSRPEYAGSQPSLATEVWSRILEFLGRLLEGITGSGRQGVVGGVVILVLVVVTVLVVVRFVSGVRRDPGRELLLSGAIGRPPEAWAAEADEHERAGRWRDALRCRYRFLIAALAARGLVDEVPGRTTGEYLAEASAGVPGASAALRRVTTAFERAWYGDLDADATTVERMRADVAGVLAALPGASAPTAAGARR